MKKFLAVIGLALLCVSAKAQTGWVTSLPSGAIKVSPYHISWVDENVFPMTSTKTAVASDTDKLVDYHFNAGVHYYFVFNKGTANEQIFEDTPESSGFDTYSIPVSVSPRGRVTYTDFTLVVYKHS